MGKPRSAMSDLLLHSREMIVNGGLVMLPILASSLIMWLLILYKGLLFFQARRAEKELSQCWQALQQHRYEGAFWQQTILRQFSWLQRRHSLNRENLLQLLHSQCNEVDRYIGTILVLAGAAPLLGLLGTVSGMITTFDVIAVFGTGNARAMAGGISIALITTQAGLVVAVPGLVLGALLHRRAEAIKEQMHRFSLNLLQKSTN